MRNCIIYYDRVKPADLNDICGKAIASLDGNTNFPDLPYSIQNMVTINDLMQSAMSAAVDCGRSKLAKLRRKKMEVATMLKETGMYINAKSRGDMQKLVSSGMPLSKEREKADIPGDIKNLKAISTGQEGIIELRWSRVKNARVYHVNISDDNGQTWKLFKSTFVCRLTCDRLLSVKRYMFKVVAENQYGTGPESSVASQIAA